MLSEWPSFRVFDGSGNRIGSLEPVDGGGCGAFFGFSVAVIVFVVVKMMVDSFVETVTDPLFIAAMLIGFFPVWFSAIKSLVWTIYGWVMGVRIRNRAMPLWWGYYYTLMFFMVVPVLDHFIFADDVAGYADVRVIVWIVYGGLGFGFLVISLWAHYKRFKQGLGWRDNIVVVKKDVSSK